MNNKEREELITEVYNNILLGNRLKNLTEVGYIAIDYKVFEDPKIKELLKEHITELSDSELASIFKELNR
ncbi:MAG: hypothetical protein HRT71_13880 [Flavobacteriales bacterium]|nr:hypothetical protein [Flavobacteriales bacterium]